jgi:hypothetical protein
MGGVEQDLLQVATRPSKIKSKIVAKSGVLVNGTQLRNAFIGGFAIADNAEAASAAAKFEVLERLHALYDIVQSNLVDERACRSVRWPTLEDAPLLPASMCLLGPHPLGPPPYLDATGLAFHTDLRQSVRHGFYEALERHFTAAAWYRGERLVELGEPRQIVGDFLCRTFTLARRPSLPFAIAVIHEEGRSFACAGASFHENLGAAVRHAVNEACLVLDGYMEHDEGLTCSDRGRLLSLRDPDLTRVRMQHFQGLVLGRDELQASGSDPSALLRNLSEHLGSVPEVRAGILCSGVPGFVTRTVVPGLRGLQKCRSEPPRGVPSDWYC